MAQGLPDHIDHFIRNQRVEEIPQAVLDHVALLLLDTLGIAIAAAPMQAGRSPAKPRGAFTGRAAGRIPPG